MNNHTNKLCDRKELCTLTHQHGSSLTLCSFFLLFDYAKIRTNLQFDAASIVGNALLPLICCFYYTCVSPVKPGTSVGAFVVVRFTSESTLRTRTVVFDASLGLSCLSVCTWFNDGQIFDGTAHGGGIYFEQERRSA